MKKWIKYIKPYTPYFILGPLCMIVEVIGEVLMPTYLAKVINSAIAGDITLLTSFGVMGMMILTAILMMLGGLGGSYFGAKASVNFATDVRNDMFAKVQKFSFSNIDKFSTGSLVTRLTNDVSQLQMMVNMGLRMMLRAPGMLIGALIMAVYMSPSLSVVFAVTIPLMILSIIFIIIRGMKLFTKKQAKIDSMNSTVQENITNVRVVKSFVRESHETNKFNKANRELKDSGMDAMKNMIFMQPVQTFFMYVTTILVIWFGSKLVISGVGNVDGFDVGSLSAFINYVGQILHSLMMVTMMLMFSSRAIASAKRVLEVLEEEIDITDSEDLDPNAKIERGDIEFSGVTFRYYKNSEEPVLDNISFKIEAGMTVGIIGSTGCGKTTLVSMIPRLYDVDSGDVKIDGRSVKQYSLHHVRENVGMVLQKNLLFSGSIEYNLRWGNNNATDDEMIIAAEHSASHKFVSTFNEGYDTLLDKGGTNLSGGQKQRLCIARALLKKPRILILDDSTSAVDTATEKQIREAFATDLPDCTKIIIAQRISSVMDADFIVVMNDGCITGIGKHQELLESNEEYNEIYYSQMDRKEA